jgi:LPXTG-motif cell wall-anchored protein
MGKTLLTRLAAVAAGGTLALVAAAPALADSHTVPINDDHVPSTAAGFPEHECEGPLGDLAGDQDGWHFLLPAASGDAFESLSLTFDTPGGQVDVLVDSTDENAPSMGAGWSGYLDGRHGWLVTDAGWTLTAGAATATNPGKRSFFNLSHTCPGEPGDGNGKPTPTPTPSPSAPGENGDGGENGDNGEDGDDEDELPVTGMQVGGLAVFGAGLLAAGAALLAVRRRRNLTDLVEGADS